MPSQVIKSDIKVGNHIWHSWRAGLCPGKLKKIRWEFCTFSLSSFSCHSYLQFFPLVQPFLPNLLYPSIFSLRLHFSSTWNQPLFFSVSKAIPPTASWFTRLLSNWLPGLSILFLSDRLMNLQLEGPTKVSLSHLFSHYLTDSTR